MEKEGLKEEPNWDNISQEELNKMQLDIEKEFYANAGNFFADQYLNNRPSHIFLRDFWKPGQPVPCFWCHKATVMRCSKCVATYYCCRDHQKRDFKEHRKFCRPVPTARTERSVQVVSPPPLGPDSTCSTTSTSDTPQ